MNARPTLILPAEINGPSLVRLADGAVVPFDAASYAGQSLDIVLPGQMVRIYAHSLPKMREKEKQAAARFAIEDRTAAALDGQHITIESAPNPRLAVVTAGSLSAIISNLDEDGITAADIYADFDWITPQSEPLVLQDRIVFTGPEGYTIDSGWADGDLAAQPVIHWADITPRPGALSLRQGAFARKTSLNLPATALSKIAALFLAVGASWLAMQWSSARAANLQAADIKAQTAALYTQATGDAAPDNPALAVTRALKNGPKNEAALLPLLAGLNAALERTDVISVQSLSFDEAKSALNLRLIYPRFESAGQMEQAAQQSGAVFRPGGVREQNEQLIGDAVFELGGAK